MIGEEEVSRALYAASWHRAENIDPQWGDLQELTRQAWYVQARAAMTAHLAVLRAAGRLTDMIDTLSVDLPQIDIPEARIGKEEVANALFKRDRQRDGHERLASWGAETIAKYHSEANLAITAHLAALEAAGLLVKWRPIETAPKDGTTIIVHGGLVYWGGSGWHTTQNMRPIEWGVRHWMPFPAPPAQNGDER